MYWLEPIVTAAMKFTQTINQPLYISKGNASVAGKRLGNRSDCFGDVIGSRIHQAGYLVGHRVVRVVGHEQAVEQ